MPHFQPRMNSFMSILSLPTSYSAGTAITFSSSVFKMTQNSGYSTLNSATTVYVPGNAYKTEIVVHASDYTKITNNGTGSCIPVNLMGSWDGNNFFLLQSNGGSASGASNNATAPTKFELVPAHANYFRIDLVLDATGALVSGHGLNVDLVIMDDPIQGARVCYYGSAVNAAATSTFTLAQNATSTGSVLGLSSNLTQTAITAGSLTTPIAMNDNVQKLYIFAALQGVSTPLTGSNCTIALQGSMDGVNWYTVTITNTALAATAKTIVINEVIANTNVSGAFIGSFFRFNVVDGGTTTWTNTSTAYLYTAITAVY